MLRKNVHAAKGKTQLAKYGVINQLIANVFVALPFFLTPLTHLILQLYNVIIFPGYGVGKH